MTAVDRPDNGQDEGRALADRRMVVAAIPHRDPCTFPDAACSCWAAENRQSVLAALASTRAGAREQQREQVARFLVSVAYGPRTDGENWFDHLIPAGQQKFLTHADELLALLDQPQDDGEPKVAPPGTVHVSTADGCTGQPDCPVPNHGRQDDGEAQPCSDCGRALTDSHEERTSGLCLRCLNGPPPEPCRVYSRGSDGYHCSVKGEHDVHHNAVGTVTW